MQQHLAGIDRPLSSRPASLIAIVRLDADGRVHHLEWEVRSIAGNLLAAQAAGAALGSTPRMASEWCHRHLLDALCEVMPFE